MKNLVCSPDVQTITMPQSTDVCEWRGFLEELSRNIAAFLEETSNSKNASVASEKNADDSFQESSGTLMDDDLVDWWVGRLERYMIEDANAASSIIGYYLEIETGVHCSIYCPLGYEPYKEIGKKMKESKEVLEACKVSGLLAEGIPDFVQSALSNDDCWDLMHPGVAHLLNDSELSYYIPFRDRYVAENMMPNIDDVQRGLIEWGDTYRYWKGTLGNELRGY